MTTYIIQWQGMDGNWNNLLSDDKTNLELLSANHAKTVARWALSQSVRWQIRDSLGSTAIYHGEVVYSSK